jgi:hypothetical protein
MKDEDGRKEEGGKDDGTRVKCQSKARAQEAVKAAGRGVKGRRMQGRDDPVCVIGWVVWVA